MKSTEKKSLISVNMEEDIQNYSPTGFFVGHPVATNKSILYFIFRKFSNKSNLIFFARNIQ